MQSKTADNGNAAGSKNSIAMCIECGAGYIACQCGTAHWAGSSSAEHYMNCPVSFLPGGGCFKPHDGMNYPPWEAPDIGLCPRCWHEKNPDREVVEVSDWLAGSFG